MNHSWLKNAVRCAFDRIYFAELHSRVWSPEAWNAVHILHRYGIEHYAYLDCSHPE